METLSNNMRWRDAKHLQRRFSVGRTKAYQIIGTIEKDGGMGVVLRDGRLVRVAEDAVIRWEETRSDRKNKEHPDA